MKKVSVIFGTRPEAIKLAPVILALNKEKGFHCSVCVTAQHRELLDQVLRVFNIVPDIDLDLMRPEQTLSDLTAGIILALDHYFKSESPDLALIQGDTTTVLGASLAAFYNRIPVGHIEAGLRTGDLFSPWPEEANRVLTSHLAAIHFAPTETNRINLIKEGISEEKIFVTGNTIVDALHFIIAKIRSNPVEIPGLAFGDRGVGEDPPIVLITGHRRENFGPSFESICLAIAELSRRFPEVQFVYPVHMNPNVQRPVHSLLSGYPNVHLIDPLDYVPFIALMDRSCLILTDSGGVQEEAPSLGKPVLVMRNTTERPEGVEMGTVKLVGTDMNSIIENTAVLLTDTNANAVMANRINPYGDGKAAGRIIKACRAFLNCPVLSL